ncbi:MAG: adenylosuccinate lyase [Gemmatimonadota bacterium]|nr:MAG: adenylosuccinate lyase [Gemmatimonadota bacterium]
MIERYTLPRMGAVWTAENRFQKWLDIEILACEAHAELGIVPKEMAQAIRQKATFKVERINELEEKKTKHDVIAFLTNVAESLGDESRYLHLGMTSYDVVDNALVLQIREACDILLEDLAGLKEVLKTKALEHRKTVMMGRTHGVHAEPITFGLKMALWFDETKRNIERLKQARATIAYGKISGAVGTMAQIDPFVEEYVCRKLGLNPAPVSSQILQRDRHAQYMTTLAIIASSLEKFATEIRNLQRTEIREVEEPFAKGQKGSSAMPHKRNPILCERISGLARVIRSNAFVSLENVALWHERDLTNSATERVVIPDSSILLNYVITKFTHVMKNLTVYPERMRHNIEATGGIIFSQSILIELVKKGLTREEAYALVQENAMTSWQQTSNFLELLLGDEKIRSYLSEDEIRACFNLDHHLKNIDYLFKRTGLG